MINKLSQQKWKPYNRYKESGVAWAGKIPNHWDVFPLKQTLKGYIAGIWGDEPTGGSQDIVCIRVADFNRIKNIISSDNLTMRSVSLSQRRKRQLRTDDLLIEKSGGGDHQPVGAVVRYNLDMPAICSNFIARLSLRDNFCPIFINYLHQVTYMIKLNVRSIKQTTGIQNLDLQGYLSEVAVFPPLTEQKKISEFLKLTTAIIDSFISKKETLIKLLREYKVLVISDVVTKGLDKSAVLKPLGVGWLGDVPEHWNIRSFASLTSPVSKRGRPDLPLLSVVREKGVIPRENMSDEENHNFIPDDLTNYKVVDSGNLVINKMKAWQGSLGIASIDGIVSPAYYVYNIAMSNKRYVHYLLRSKPYVDLFARASDGVRIGQWDLRIADLKKIPILIPPIEEQAAIVDYLREKSLEIERVIELTKHQIQSLYEYRNRLIFDVVTGKIDVRVFSSNTIEDNFNSLLAKRVAEQEEDYS